MAQQLYDWLIAEPSHYPSEFQFTSRHDILATAPDSALTEFFDHPEVRPLVQRGQARYLDIVQNGLRQATDPEFLRSPEAFGMNLTPAEELLREVDQFIARSRAQASRQITHEQAEREVREQMQSRHRDIRDVATDPRTRRDFQRRIHRRTQEDAPRTSRGAYSAEDLRRFSVQFSAHYRELLARQVRSALQWNARFRNYSDRPGFYVSRKGRAGALLRIPLQESDIADFQIEVVGSSRDLQVRLTLSSGGEYVLSGPYGAAITDVRDLFALSIPPLTFGDIPRNEWAQLLAGRLFIESMRSFLNITEGRFVDGNIRTEEDLNNMRGWYARAAEQPYWQRLGNTIIAEHLGQGPSIFERTSRIWLYLGIAESPTVTPRGIWKSRQQNAEVYSPPIVMGSGGGFRIAQRPQARPGRTQPSQAPFAHINTDVRMTNHSGSERVEVYRIQRGAEPTFYTMVDTARLRRQRQRQRVRSISQEPSSAHLSLESSVPLAAIEGMIAIPSPDERALTALRLETATRQRLQPGRDYGVYFSEFENGYYILLREPHASRAQDYRLAAGFGDVGTRPRAQARSTDLAPLRNMDFDRVQMLSQELEAAGLRPLAAAVRARVSVSRQTGVPLSARDLEEIFRREGRYSYAPEASQIPESARSSIFADHARFLDSEGRHCAQCTGMNALWDDFMGHYLEEHPLLSSRTRSGFAVGFEPSLTLADAHRRSEILLAGRTAEVFDTTASLSDSRSESEDRRRSPSGPEVRAEQVSESQPSPRRAEVVSRRLQTARGRVVNTTLQTGLRGESPMVEFRQTLRTARVIESVMSGTMSLDAAKRELSDAFPTLSHDYNSLDELLRFASARGEAALSYLQDAPTPRPDQIRRSPWLRTLSDPIIRSQWRDLAVSLRDLPLEVNGRDVIARLSELNTPAVQGPQCTPSGTGPAYRSLARRLNSRPAISSHP